MINPDEFNQLFVDIIKLKKPVDINYRLYYNKETGKPLQYTTDEKPTTLSKYWSKGRSNEKIYYSIICNIDCI